MNKLLLTTLGMFAALSAFAQGTFNASNNYTPTGASNKAFIFATDGTTPLAKAIGKVAILNAADGSYLSANGANGVSLLGDGLFFINGLSVPGVATGGTAQIIVQAWDSTTGATYSSALSKAEGLITVQRLGGGPTPPATFAADSNFVGLTVSVIPEPSTVALAALGVAGLFFVARRKN